MNDENNKWAYSDDGEYYTGTFSTKEEAIAEASEIYNRFWVGRAVPPPAPECMWCADDWLEYVSVQEEYSGDWAENWDSGITRDEKRELEEEVSKVIAAWLDRHNRRPRFFVIEDAEEVTSNH